MVKGYSVPRDFSWIENYKLNFISDTFEEHWNCVLFDARKKLVQLLLKESESIVSGIEIQIDIEISNDYTTTGSTKHKQLEEKHLKFRQQLENRRAKKRKKFKERSRKERCGGVVQERANRDAKKMKQIVDSRSDPLTKTEGDNLQLNVTNSVLTDNMERDNDFKGIDCTSENNNLLKKACFDNITDNRKLRSRKNKAYAEPVSG